MEVYYVEELEWVERKNCFFGFFSWVFILSVKNKEFRIECDFKEDDYRFWEWKGVWDRVGRESFSYVGRDKSLFMILR